MTTTSFRTRMRSRRPDVVAQAETHEFKRKLALALRALRKEKQLTQKDIEARSTLTQPMISRLEAPAGGLPNWDTVMRYVQACDGHMLLGFSGSEFDERAFVSAPSAASEDVVSAVAM